MMKRISWAGLHLVERGLVVDHFGGNNQSRFDPFLIQLIRMVDSSDNEHCLEVVSPGWGQEAGSAALGKRQADAFLRAKSKPRVEHDVWASKESDRPREVTP